MADIFVDLCEELNSKGEPLIGIAIEPNPKANDGTSFSFEDKHGFGFIMRLQDAIGMAAAIGFVADSLRGPALEGPGSRVREAVEKKLKETKEHAKRMAGPASRRRRPLRRGSSGSTSPPRS